MPPVFVIMLNRIGDEVLDFRSKVVRSLLFAVILALVFVFLWHVFGYDLLSSGIISVFYYLASFWLGYRTASRSRGSISGFVFGVATAAAKTVVWSYIGLIHVNYVLEVTFIAGLGGFYGYLNRLALPLARKGGSGINVFRDYWSNRQMFDKNRFPEDPDLDLGTRPELPTNLFLKPRNECVDVAEDGRGTVIRDLQNPQTLALRYEPLWNPVPLAVEKRIGSWIMPASIGLSIASILLSMINIVPSSGNEAFLLETAFPILLVFVLCLLLIRKVQAIHNLKPESSLTLLFLFLFLPVLTFGISSLSYSAWQGTAGTANLWVPILYVCLFVLVASSLRIRDSENISVYLYQTSIENLLSLWYRQDTPSWIKGDTYWVFRYMYYWPLEITIPLPHPDWERVEVWVNAKTGKPEWITTDYHYRELWYEVVGDIERVVVDFDPSFHTPLPVNFREEQDYILQVLERLSLFSHIISQIRFIIEGKWYNLWAGVSFESELRTASREKHPANSIVKVTGSKILASRLASLHWKEWRYTYGADQKHLYSATAKNYPASPPTIEENEPYGFAPPPHHTSPPTSPMPQTTLVETESIDERTYTLKGLFEEAIEIVRRAAKAIARAD